MEQDIYYRKYIKYKQKYEILKKQLGGERVDCNSLMSQSNLFDLLNKDNKAIPR